MKTRKRRKKRKMLLREAKTLRKRPDRINQIANAKDKYENAECRNFFCNF